MAYSHRNRSNLQSTRSQVQLLLRILKHDECEVVLKAATPRQPCAAPQGSDYLLPLCLWTDLQDTVPPCVLPDPVGHRQDYPRGSESSYKVVERCSSGTDRWVL